MEEFALAIISKLFLLQNRIRKSEPSQKVPITKFYDVRKTITVCVCENLRGVYVLLRFTILTHTIQGYTNQWCVAHNITYIINIKNLIYAMNPKGNSTNTWVIKAYSDSDYT